jgi:hypothetical protein
VASKGRPYRRLEVEGFAVLVGKGDAENDRLTFEIAEPRDWWLHVAGHSGSHVVVCNPDELDELPRPVLERAAELAAWHSKARGTGRWSARLPRRGVSKPRGAPVGTVRLRRWTSLRVYPRDQPPRRQRERTGAQRRPEKDALKVKRNGRVSSSLATGDRGSEAGTPRTPAARAGAGSR